MQLLDGKQVSLQLQSKIAAKTQEMSLLYGRVPHLAAVLVGNNPASESYVGSKIKALYI